MCLPRCCSRYTEGVSFVDAASCHEGNSVEESELLGATANHWDEASVCDHEEEEVSLGDVGGVVGSFSEALELVDCVRAVYSRYER